MRSPGARVHSREFTRYKESQMAVRFLSNHPKEKADPEPRDQLTTLQCEFLAGKKDARLPIVS